jgi:hypothetical protein
VGTVANAGRLASIGAAQAAAEVWAVSIECAVVFDRLFDGQRFTCERVSAPTVTWSRGFNRAAYLVRHIYRVGGRVLPKIVWLCIVDGYRHEKTAEISQ